MNLLRYRKSLIKVWRRWTTRILSGHRILVLSDSHSGVLEYCFDRGYLAPHWLNCEIVGGATAYGLNNDSSVTMAWQRFNQALIRYADYDVVLIMLGECDCSYALWKKSERTGEPVEHLLHQSVCGIARLVERVLSDVSKKRRVILVGSILPTIADANASSQLNLLRREIKATQLERTQLVLSFNASLAAFAHEKKISYFDVTTETIDPQTGVLDRRYQQAMNDHHLSQGATGKLWAAKLLECLRC